MTKDEPELDAALANYDADLRRREDEVEATKKLIQLGILNENGHPTGCGCETCGGMG